MEQDDVDKRAVVLKSGVKNRGSKSANYATATQRGDRAVIETALAIADEKVEVTEEDIDNAIVLNNGMTSVDFMMPENERQILEENLNLYSNLEQTQKVLNVAKRNKKISEDIKTLQLISKTGDFANQAFDVLNDDKVLDSLLSAFKKKVEKGETGKAVKELATAIKIILDARQDMIKSLNSQGNKKSARIALKFTNESGEEVQMGVDI